MTPCRVHGILFIPASRRLKSCRFMTEMQIGCFRELKVRTRCISLTRIVTTAEWSIAGADVRGLNCPY